MVKQTKKGSIGKKALSAILAASMIMTSSSFVMAAPVVEEVVSVDENARAEIAADAVVVDEVTYAGKALNNEIKVTVSNGALINGTDYTVSYLDEAKNPVAEVKDAGTYYAKIELSGSHVAADGTNIIETEFEVKPFEINGANADVKYSESGYFYNGNKQAPTVTSVTVADAPADLMGALEVVPYDNNYDMISAKTQKIKLALKEDVKNYTLTGELGVAEYIIDKAKTFDVTVSAEDMAYTGAAVTPDVVVKDSAGNEVDGATYDIQYVQNGNVVAQPINMGTYTIKVVSKGTGNYEEKLEAFGTFKIVAADLAVHAKVATIAGTTKDKDGNYVVTYNGSEYSITAASVSLPNAIAANYKVTPEDGVKVTNAGDTAVFTLTGMNDWAGQSATLTVKVAPKEIVKDAGKYTINAVASKGVTNKDDVILTITDTDTTKELVKGTDYTVESIDLKNKTVLVKGAGNYTTAEDSKGNANAGIKVDYTESTTGVYLQDSRITVDAIADQTWSGKQITPAVVVKDTTVTPAKTLKKGTDYEVTYGANTDTGKGTITITPVKTSTAYLGERVVEFNIVGTDISKTYKLAPMDSVKLSETIASTPTVTIDTLKLATKLIYTSNGASAPVSVTFDKKYYSDAEFKNEITDLKAFASSLKNIPATVYVKAIGTGKYSGEVTEKFEIVGDNTFKVDEKIADQAYSGKAIEPEVAVKDADTNAPLTKDKDYTVTYENNTKVGVAYITVKGIGKYEGTKILSFNIVGEMDQEISVLPAQEKALKTRTLNSDATKVKFTKVPETTVTYASSDEDVVIVDDNGNIKYTGLGTATITIKAAAENGYKEAVKELEVVVGLAQPTFTPFSKNDAFTLTTSTVKGAKKFQVQYVAAGKSFTSSTAKTKTFTGDNKLKQGKVAAGNKKTYRIRVRAINGSTKSKWSPVKTVATK